MKQCPACKAQVPEDTPECPSCHEIFEKLARQQGVDQGITSLPKPVSYAILVLLLAGGGYFFYSLIPQDKTVQWYLDATQEEKEAVSTLRFHGEVVPEKINIFQMRSGGASMGHFSLKDTTGEMQIFYDQGLIERTPTAGDRLTVVGKVETIRTPYGESHTFIPSKIKFD